MKHVIGTFLVCSVAVSVYAGGNINNKYDNLEKIGNKASRTPSSKSTTKSLCERRTIVYENEQKPLIFQLENSLRNKSVDLFTRLLDKKFTVNSFNYSTVAEPRAIGGDIYLSKLEAAVAKITDKQALVKDLKSYFAKFKKIEKVEFDVFKKDQLQTKGTQIELVSSRFAIKGEDVDGHRVQDTGIMDVTLKLVGMNWKIQEIKMSGREFAVKKSEPFYKLASTIEPKTYQRLEAIRRGGYAISVGDFDGDKYQDLLVGGYGPMELYRGNGKGEMTKVTNSGIPPWPLVKAAVWADFDNDGDQDLLIVRFTEDEPNQTKDKEQSFKLTEFIETTVMIYENDGAGKFALKEQKFNDYSNEVRGRAMPVAVADFNGDGLLDVYIGYPGVKDFTTFSQDQLKKYGERVQGLYINAGNLKFKMKDMSKDFKPEIFDQYNMVYPHSAVALDVDKNGTSDLVVVDDRGNISPIYGNDGKANFSEYSKRLGIEHAGFGMGAAAADINGDGHLDLAFSNVTFESDEMTDNCTKSANPKKALSLFVNNKLESQNAATRFTPIDNNDLDFPGRGLAGVEFLDYDQDGSPDLFVSNGLWSGTSKEAKDISGIVTRALENDTDRVLYESVNHTKSYVMDVLGRYKDKKGHYLSMAGFQSKRLYKNLGKNRFYDVAYLEGVDSSFDGYIIATADLNQDGVQDLVLRNADPGTIQVHNPPVQIFMGQPRKTNHLNIVLRGTESNHDGVGAEVTVEVDGMPVQTQQLIANNGCAQSQKALFFSLGKQEVAKSVQIRWPSGKIQKFENMKKGSTTIQESDRTMASR